MTQEKIRKPLIAGMLSFLSIGLGFVYNGSFSKGVIVTLCYFLLELLLGIVGVYKSFPFALGATVVLTLIWIYFIGYTASRARKIGAMQLKTYNRWYVYLLYFLVFLSPSFLIDTTAGTGSYNMPTGSMSPALEEGEHVAIDETYYRQHEIKHGDVILFSYPKDHNELMLKRCIALGGETVQLRDGLAYVNGERSLPTLLLKRMGSKIKSADFNDSRIVPQDAGNEDHYGPLVVPDGKVFVLGDCRDNSLDSRYFGFVDREEIVGKVLYIWWSGDFSRIGKAVQ
jgi:signal peptidase I